MPIVFAVLIGVALVIGWFSLTARPSVARANLFAGINMDTKPQESGTRALGAKLRRFVPTGIIKSMETDLSQAGHPHGMDVPKLIGIQAVLMVTLFIVPTVFGQPLIGLLGVVLGFIGPRIWVTNAKQKRRESISGEVGDTLDQLTICVEAGIGFDAALARVAGTDDGPLARELQHTVQDMRAGMPRDVALRALAERSQIPEIKAVTQALIQAQRHGTPLSDTLRTQASEMRDKRRQALEEKAAKLGTKLIFPTVLLFFPVLFIVLLAPSIMELGNYLPH
jgi:tight adherence protein C